MEGGREREGGGGRGREGEGEGGREREYSSREFWCPPSATLAHLPTKNCGSLARPDQSLTPAQVMHIM